MFHHMLITNMFPSLLRSSGWLNKIMKHTIICHTGYREPLNVTIINVSNIEKFHLQTSAVYCFLSTLVMLPWWWWQKWSIHIGN